MLEDAGAALEIVVTSGVSICRRILRILVARARMPLISLGGMFIACLLDARVKFVNCSCVLIMNRCLAAIGSGVLILVASVLSAHAVTITYGAPGSETPGFAGAAVLNFDAVPLGPLGSYNFGGGTLTGDGAVVSGSLVNRYAAPAGDSTRYLTVAYGAPVGSATLFFISPENYFGLYWGSIDSYNSISFELDGQTIATYTGSQLPAPLQANGDPQSSLSNRYVNFFFGAQFFDEVVLHTTNYAFESDNIAYADPPVPVPEPGTLVSLLSALAGMGMWSWLRNRKKTRGRALAS